MPKKITKTKSPPKKEKAKTEKPKAKPQWTFQGKQDFEVPELAVGFVYLIKVKDTPFYYYGKKNLTSTRGRGKNKKTTESTWRNYESSSKELKELIKKGATIEKEILEFAYSKSELTLLEAKYIICNNCLEDRNSLNRWVYCRVYQKNIIKN
jgi:hypothetical protein